MANAQQNLQASVLFTAFEPSGDAHAAPVIAELLRRLPDLHVYAWGGPKMEAAGATILGHTAEDGAMGLGAIKKARAVRKEIKRIRQWSRNYRVLAHIPVDSPAANFPICRSLKKTGTRVIHLIAPQLWAWGGWRIRKLRRLTDGVLCLLPFEEQWFKDRDVPARFIGHPQMNPPPELSPDNSLDASPKNTQKGEPTPEEVLRDEIRGLPQGSPRIALFPGSRSQEVKANIRLLVATFTELKDRYSGMNGVIFAANPTLAAIVRKKVSIFPTGLHLVVNKTEAGIQWCDLAFAVSGTISLDITRQSKPMIGVYKTGLFSWLLSKFILRTPYRLLPNIIADREIVPEFIPHPGGPMPLVRAANPLLQDSRNMAFQTEELRRVAQRFAHKRPAEEAANLIIKILKDGTLS